MTSKFGGKAGPQPTPKICKKSPPPPEFPNPVFELYPLQGYASWNDPFSPVDGYVTGQTEMASYSFLNLHAGVIEGDRLNLELDLIYFPGDEHFELTILLVDGSIVLESVVFSFTDPQPGIPFVTELFISESPGQNHTVQAQIYS